MPGRYSLTHPDRSAKVVHLPPPVRSPSRCEVPPSCKGYGEVTPELSIRAIRFMKGEIQPDQLLLHAIEVLMKSVPEDAVDRSVVELRAEQS